MSFGSSSNGRFRQGDEWSEATSSFDNAAFNDIAENIATTVHHGSRAIVARQLYQPFYANRDGNERPELNLTVEAWGPNLRFAGAAIMRTVRVTAPAGADDLVLTVRCRCDPSSQRVSLLRLSGAGWPRSGFRP